MKIGLLFGSFNPVHLGHMSVAEYMAESTDLEEVWFIVSPQNPEKASSSLLADTDRLEMVKLAIADHPKLKVSDVEFNLPKPSYTINTIRNLKEKYPEHQFVLIIGEDNLANFDHWKDYEEILRACMVYVYPREKVEKSKLHFHPKIKLISNAPLMDISATLIRHSIRSEEDVSYILPQAVAKYIEEKGFYK